MPKMPSPAAAPPLRPPAAGGGTALVLGDGVIVGRGLLVGWVLEGEGEGVLLELGVPVLLAVWLADAEEVRPANG